MSKVEPCSGQRSSLPLIATVANWCGQTAEKPITSPAVGCDTITGLPATSRLTAPATGTSDSLTSGVATLLPSVVAATPSDPPVLAAGPLVAAASEVESLLLQAVRPAAPSTPREHIANTRRRLGPLTSS